jgi:hypothetical protein
MCLIPSRDDGNSLEMSCSLEYRAKTKFENPIIPTVNIVLVQRVQKPNVLFAWLFKREFRIITVQPMSGKL